jgi:hypothetical protein
VISNGRFTWMSSKCCSHVTSTDVSPEARLRGSNPRPRRVPPTQAQRCRRFLRGFQRTRRRLQGQRSPPRWHQRSRSRISLRPTLPWLTRFRDTPNPWLTPGSNQPPRRGPVISLVWCIRAARGHVARGESEWRTAARRQRAVATAISPASIPRSTRLSFWDRQASRLRECHGRRERGEPRPFRIEDPVGSDRGVRLRVSAGEPHVLPRLAHRPQRPWAPKRCKHPLIRP